MRKSLVAGLLLGISTFAAARGRSAAQCDPVRGGRPARRHGRRSRRAQHGAARPRQGVHLRNGHSLFPTFTTANASAMATGHYFGDTGRLQQHDLCGLPGPQRQRLGDPVHRERPGARRPRPALRRLSRRAHDPEARPRPWLWHGGAGQARAHPDLRPYRPRRRARPIVFDDATGTEKGIPLAQEVLDRLTAAGPAGRDAAARRQRQGRRRHDARHALGQRDRSRIISPPSRRAWCCRCWPSATSPS